MKVMYRRSRNKWGRQSYMQYFNSFDFYRILHYRNVSLALSACHSTLNIKLSTIILTQSSVWGKALIVRSMTWVLVKSRLTVWRLTTGWTAWMHGAVNNAVCSPFNQLCKWMLCVDCSIICIPCDRWQFEMSAVVQLVFTWKHFVMFCIRKVN